LVFRESFRFVRAKTAFGPAAYRNRPRRVWPTLSSFRAPGCSLSEKRQPMKYSGFADSMDPS
jgi:hypothetical protein